MVNESEEDEDTFCMIYSEFYSKSRSGETWIQCTQQCCRFNVVRKLILLLILYMIIVRLTMNQNL